MTVDRAQLRKLCEPAGPGPHEIADVLDDLQQLVDAVPLLLDEIDVKDRRIAELEASAQLSRSGAAEAVHVHDEQVARIAELESELTATTEQSDSWRTQAQRLAGRVVDEEAGEAGQERDDGDHGGV